MKITTIATALATTFATSGAVGVCAPIASADDAATQTLGNQAKAVDGDIIQGWTISNLKASTDEIPYPLSGTLWEATATNEALQGSVTPIVPNLTARARSGQTYHALFQVATPQGVNPATLAQGEKTTGKVYFDVTGDTPETVVYNGGGQNLLTWVQPPPTPQAQTTWTPAPARNQVTPAPAVRPATTGPAAIPATPAPAATPATPAPAATPATPAPAATPATPAPAGPEATPSPAGSQGTPLPPGSQGTPLPAGSQGTPLTSLPGSTPAPLPTPPAGTPHLPNAGSMPTAGGSQSTQPPAGGQGTPTPAITPATTTVVAPSA